MEPVEAVAAHKQGLEKSYLVSGGCNTRGQVPLFEKWDHLKVLAERAPLNVHCGLMEPEDAARIGSIAETVSFDLVADAGTIQRVYGLELEPECWLRSYRALVVHARVIPHICIGLDAGKISGEFKALNLLRGEAPEAISFIVFRPTPGTVFANAPVPSLEETAAVLVEARLAFPRTPLYLGCMRPGGRYRGQLDLLAIRAGINKIVMPAAGARSAAAEMGLNIIDSEECCSL